MEGLLEGPVVLIVLATIFAALGLAKVATRWRRESGMRRHASQQGWRSVGESDALGTLVTDVFPEVRQETEQEARATRRTGGRHRGGPGLTISLGRGRPSTRSRVRGRNVHVVPTDAGELAAGDVTVTGTAGKLSLGRASISRGAVAGRLPAALPPLKIFNRSWVDRDGGEDAVPAEFASQFSVEALGPDARAAYVDSGAWRHLVDGSSHIDGVTVEDDTVVLVSRRCLDPERTAALTAATQEFLSTAARSVDDAGSRPAKVDNPLPVS